MLYQLCRKHTNLTNVDISELGKLRDSMHYYCEVTGADYFIDVFQEKCDYAVVVAHSKPQNSLYNDIIIGEKVSIANEPAVFNSYKNNISARGVKGINQENKIVNQHTTPIKNHQNKIIGVLVMEEDVTNSIMQNDRVDELLKSTEQLTEALLSTDQDTISITNHIKEGIVVLNDEHLVIYANNEAQEIYNRLGCDKILGFSMRDLFLEELESYTTDNTNMNVREVNLGQMSLQIRCSMSTSSNKYWMVLFIEDITDIKNKERELINKSVMVQEMHHRIKNNLQIVASLLNLQIHKIDNEEMIQILKENISRIISISSVHQILCESNSLEDIAIMQLLEEIKSNTLQCYTSEDKKISIDIVGDDIMIASEKAVSIAIILSELLTNSVKHGFKNRKEGSIRIEIQKGQFYSSLTVIDDGIGYDTVKDNYDSIGMEIVKATIKEKLNGNINITSDNTGTSTFFDFKM